MPELGFTLDICDPQLRFLTAGRIDAYLEGDVAIKTVPYTIIAQVLQGAYEITRLGETARIEAGEAFLTGANVPLHIVHRGDPRDDMHMRVRFLHFHYTCLGWVDFTSLLNLPLRLAAQQLERAGPAIGAIWSLQHAAEPHMTPLARETRLRELALTVLADICAASPMRPDAAERMHALGRLQPVIDHMRTTLDQPLRVADLARVAHLSPSRFHALFREAFGWAPMEYLKLLRLGEARRLLAATDARVYDIAERTGFNSPFHLAREFKARFGRTPTQYRRAWADGSTADPLPEPPH